MAKKQDWSVGRGKSTRLDVERDRAWRRRMEAMRRERHGTGPDQQQQAPKHQKGA